jgi:hypothetical protein
MAESFLEELYKDYLEGNTSAEPDVRSFSQQRIECSCKVEPGWCSKEGRNGTESNDQASS